MTLVVSLSCIPAFGYYVIGIIEANNRRIHTLEEFECNIEKNQGGAVLIECRSGTLGYFKVNGQR